jgi:hypothetical protein
MKSDVWDVLFWIGMIVLIGYIVLKLLGIINTPDWVDLVPVITIVFIVGITYQKILGFMDRIYHRTGYLKRKLDKHDERLDKLEEKRKWE